MFTGIITQQATINTLHKGNNEDVLMDVCMQESIDDIAIGASIAHDGVCLTVLEKNNDEHILTYAMSQETLACTTAKHWQVGDILNVERALKVGDELGGHMVLGHVDDVIAIAAIDPVADSYKVSFTMPDLWAPFIAPKGSVTLNGVSLTVNEVDDSNKKFSVNLLEFTYKHTNFYLKQVGSQINLEIDAIARYITRHQTYHGST